MIKEKYINVEITNGNKTRHYKKTGYECKKGDIIKVKIEDLTPYCTEEIPCICDYCGKEVITRYDFYYSNTTTTAVSKYACKDCIQKKKEECNEVLFGCKNQFQRKDIKAEIIINNLEKYGVENISQTDYFKIKYKEVINERYGVDHIMQLQEIKDKVVSKSLAVRYKNGTAPASSQQIYLHKLLGGELNYPVDKISLDIAFLGDKIYIEYNGSGHDIDVKYKKMTKEQFRFKEIKRYGFLKSLGWKQIVIESPKDFLPSDEEIINQINIAKDYLINNKSSHYIIDINDDNFKNLRKIIKTSTSNSNEGIRNESVV